MRALKRLSSPDALERFSSRSSSCRVQNVSQDLQEGVERFVMPFGRNAKIWDTGYFKIENFSVVFFFPEAWY